MAVDTIELRTQTLGQQFLKAGKEGFWQKLQGELRLDEKLIGWAMGHETLRVQLFRAIDALPALTSKAEIARHLREYLAEEAQTVPGMATLLNIGTDDPRSPQATLAATAFEAAVKTLARRYICGANLEETLKTIENLRRDRYGFTVDVLGEAVVSETEARRYLDRYLELMHALAERSKTWAPVPIVDGGPRLQVSVKLSAFYSRFDPLAPDTTRAKVGEPVRTLLREAARLGCAVHFDMEQAAYKDLTLLLLKEILQEPEFRDRDDVGITVQGYLRHSERDLQGIIAWAKERGTPLTVRLVKGAYWDTETIEAYQRGWEQPVYNEKPHTDGNYENLIRLLLENHRYLYAAIGSHNARSIAKAIALAEHHQIAPRGFEVQALYGMGQKFLKPVVDMGQRVRVYCPYGELIPGMAYLIRRLLENTANTSFLRQSDLNEASIAQLLSPPPAPPTAPQTLGVPFDGFQNAPDRDYSEAIARDKAQFALNRVAQAVPECLPYLNGQYRRVERFVDSVCPSQPSHVVGRIGLADVQLTEEAIAAAKAAFPGWKRLGAAQRAAVLRKAADIMETRRDELAARIVWEAGKPLREADAEVSEAIDFCRYNAHEAERLARPRHRNVPGETNLYHYQPRGLAVVISPWNFPLAIACGMSVAALAAGNTVLFKPALVTATIGADLNAILQEAGCPPGVFNYLPGKGSEIGPSLTNHPDIHLIAFTGSQEVGCQIYAEAAQLRPGQKHLKRVIAEMGGKNAIIIDESADLDRAVVDVMRSAFGYAGQKCSACSRAIVLAPIYDTFTERLKEAVASLRIGPAHLPDTDVGPVIDGSAQRKIQEYIARGKQDLKLLLEMAAPTDGYYVGPTLFQDVPPAHPLAQEEIFGPVLCILKAQNFDEAIAILNHSDYALTGGLHSRTPSHIERAYAELEVGNLYINRGITGALVDRQPFGGFKLSGIGSKAGGPDYLLQFLEPRTVTENVQRQGFAPIEVG